MLATQAFIKNLCFSFFLAAGGGFSFLWAAYTFFSFSQKEKKGQKQTLNNKAIYSFFGLVLNNRFFEWQQKQKGQ
ncbi:MAG TPA: hypothetical protein VI977_00970 [archaeon]|nr:hypothetical protein [archaeon]